MRRRFPEPTKLALVLKNMPVNTPSKLPRAGQADVDLFDLVSDDLLHTICCELDHSALHALSLTCKRFSMWYNGLPFIQSIAKARVLSMVEDPEDAERWK